jgi:hypothetical protein
LTVLDSRLRMSGQSRPVYHVSGHVTCASKRRLSFHVRALPDFRSSIELELEPEVGVGCGVGASSDGYIQYRRAFQYTYLSPICHYYDCGLTGQDKSGISLLLRSVVIFFPGNISVYLSLSLSLFYSQEVLYDSVEKNAQALFTDDWALKHSWAAYL